jgi:DNA-binding LytR/AlgR family response regulator
MSDNSRNDEAEYIHAAYAEKVKEAFLGFAENLSVGQAEKSCKERFQRSLLMIKKARDIALVAITEVITVETEAAREEVVADGLSDEDRAMIEHALSGTTGVAKPAPARLR